MKKIVKEITSEKEHIEFWKYIFHRDQDMRRRPDIENIDQENLILVSYYFNQFGYPTEKILGRESHIINYVWVHTTCNNAKKITFPIILHAWKSRHVSEKDMREYFVRQLYLREYDDRGHFTKTFGTLFQELQLNVTDKINIPELVMTLDDFNMFLDQERMLIGDWKMRGRKDTFYLDQKMIVKDFEGARIQIFKTRDGLYFLKNVYDIEMTDPIPLECSEIDKNIYKDKYKQTDKYYQITSEGDLLYRTKEKVIHTYYQNQKRVGYPIQSN